MTHPQTPTREEVEKRLETSPIRAAWNGGTVLHILDALAHFAPARTRMMIEGMTVEEIEKEMLKERDRLDSRYMWTHHDSANVAHRLANTPALVVDPDARAKELFAIYAKAVGSYYVERCSTKDHITQCDWAELDEEHRNGWRAVAAAEKSNG